MSKTIQQKMHSQHRQWQSDSDTWRSDIDEWKKELRVALGDLREVEDMLRDSLDALTAHADSVWESEQRRCAHELELREEAKRGAGKKTDKGWAKIHREHAARHERLADAHARIKKYQHNVVAEVTRLLRAARKGM
ncbi:MAG: hypothetical protein ACM3NI_07935 [Bacteroidota bacterium]